MRLFLFIINIWTLSAAAFHLWCY